MNKKIVTALIVGLLSLLGMLSIPPLSSHAAGVYRTITSKNYAAEMPAYHAKNSNKSAYIWNNNLTKKKHNLKNYPRTTWFVTKSYKMTNGKKTGIFYRLQDVTGTKTGLVWRGYLTKGVNQKSPRLADNTYSFGLTNKYYLNELNRQVVKQFTGTSYSQQASKLVLDDISDNLNTTLSDAIKEEMGTTKVIVIGVPDLGSPTSVAKIKQLVLKSGKINDFNSYQGWSIGVCMWPTGSTPNGEIVLTK